MLTYSNWKLSYLVSYTVNTGICFVSMSGQAKMHGDLLCITISFDWPYNELRQHNILLILVAARQVLSAQINRQPISALHSLATSQHKSCHTIDRQPALFFSRHYMIATWWSESNMAAAFLTVLLKPFILISILSLNSCQCSNRWKI